MSNFRFIVASEAFDLSRNRI